MALAAIRSENGSLVVSALVNGKPCDMIIDSGDAIGPTFTTADATRLGLPAGAAEGIDGATGAGSVYATTATVAIGDTTFADEPSAVDPGLTGYSLIGLPFFVAKGNGLLLDWHDRTMLLL